MHQIVATQAATLATRMPLISAVTCADCGQAGHTVQCAWDECTPHRHHCVRDAVGELGQGLDLALLVAGCQEQTSGGPGLTPSRQRAFQLLHHEREETRWAPALAPGQAPRDHQPERPPCPPCLIPCQPVSPSRCTSPCRAACLLQRPNAKALSRLGKDLDLRKLLARGQDLNLRPLGYEHYDARLSCRTAAPENAHRWAKALPTSPGIGAGLHCSRPSHSVSCTNPCTRPIGSARRSRPMFAGRGKLPITGGTARSTSRCPHRAAAAAGRAFRRTGRPAA